MCWKAEVLDLPTQYWLPLPHSNLKKPQPTHHPRSLQLNPLLLYNTKIKFWKDTLNLTHVQTIDTGKYKSQAGTEHLCTVSKLP